MVCQRVLILGGDADGNLGDRAILQSMCQELRRVDPTVIIHVIASNLVQSDLADGVKVITKGSRGIMALCCADMIQAKIFREDLYFRISGITIELPPLRERDDDIVVLARIFLEKSGYRENVKRIANCE